MKLLKNRKFAVLITVVVVILATLLGVRGSLNRLAGDVEAMFYDGVYLKDNGYKQPGINPQLEICAQTALNYATILVNNPALTGEAEALLSAQREFIDAKSIREKYSANESMQNAFEALTKKAESTGLSQQETDAMSRHISTFRGAQTMIRSSEYNQQAQSFMDDASNFARLLRPFLFVKSPQMFA